MSKYFPDVPPPQLSQDEKRQAARRFRRAANLTDGCGLLGSALLFFGDVLHGAPANFLAVTGLLLLAAFFLGCALTYHRCPVCGNRIIRGEYSKYLRPFVWRGYECPVCCFSPD